MEFQAGRGEWFCAREWTRLFGDQGRQAEALEMLAPYVATGWWPAAWAQGELLESWGRTEEAIALARPYAEVGGTALEFFARLLTRHGRQDKAVVLLSAGIEDRLLATALVDITRRRAGTRTSPRCWPSVSRPSTGATPRGVAAASPRHGNRPACRGP
ncbi:hypothetical protein OHB56_31645 [Streptomyces sp. NBC_01635]|uniref:hypothetical protein n=1 Tax=Streptomyces sp. NBC_01635 TaxID=2975904 RepID=UPI0038651970|nr:hypothetical protein OHB56_31645 [Streptomyces sp. NBC_01635]